MKIPVLDLFSNQFPYRSFFLNNAFAEISSVHFPSQQLLGKQAEFLFEHLLKESPEYDILGANIQIQGATETLGEIDYLVFQKSTQSVTHIELACKFYLLDTVLGDSLVEQWIGPNRKDRLSDKLSKLKNKQFPMLYRPETLPNLESLAISAKDIEQKLCLKAFLFLPLQYNSNLLPEVYRTCVAGTYLKPTEFNNLDPDAQYAFPQKKEWLLPEEAIKHWISFKDAIKQIEHVTKEKQSALVYIKVDKLIRKVFVVWW